MIDQDIPAFVIAKDGEPIGKIINKDSVILFNFRGDRPNVVYAVSETQKYGHVTYFWNGNKSEKFSEELETFKEIPSDKVSFDERPWMKSAEITDDLIKAVDLGLANVAPTIATMFGLEMPGCWEKSMI